MGVDFSKERSPLAIACVAETMQLDPTQFVSLRTALQAARSFPHCHALQMMAADPTDHEPSTNSDAGSDVHVHELQSAWRAKDLTIEAFAHAMESCEIVTSDQEILRHMFVLMDRTGDELIHSLELLIASALLVKGSFESKLELATTCLVSDLHATPLATTHLQFLLSTLATAAHYFGDQLLPLPALEGIADDIFQELQGTEDFEAVCGSQALLVQIIAKHPVVQDYVSQDAQPWSPR